MAQAQQQRKKTSSGCPHPFPPSLSGTPLVQPISRTLVYRCKALDNGLQLIKELIAQLRSSQQLAARCQTVMFDQEQKLEEMHRTYKDTTSPPNIRRYIDMEQNTVER